MYSVQFFSYGATQTILLSLLLLTIKSGAMYSLNL